MARLDYATLLQIWEVGQRQHPIDQALSILRAAFPHDSWQSLGELSIGQRDARLLRVYEKTFGQTLMAIAICAACQEVLEFSFRVADIQEPATTKEASAYELALEGYQLRFRLPNSFDLAAIVNSHDVSGARRILLQRCVLKAQRDGQAVNDLPPDVMTALAEQMSKNDPQAEVIFNLSCPACGHQWQALFDVLAFLSPKIAQQAKRLLHEVHALASAYGWHEADILSMSAVRRQFYLEMVT